MLISIFATNETTKSVDYYLLYAYYYAPHLYALVAQLDRVLPSEGRGRGFNSRRVRHKINTPHKNARIKIH